MKSIRVTRLMTWLLGPALLAVLVGCPGGGSSGASFTRRGVEREYLSSPEYGVPRGRRFEDIIPVGARIKEVHVVAGQHVDAIWLSYERNGVVRETPRRGRNAGRPQSFKLKSNEKIIGIHGFGRSTVEGLVIATNMRTKAFGRTPDLDATSETPWYDELSRDEKRRYVGVGIVGRADTELRQISLRLQVREKG